MTTVSVIIVNYNVRDFVLQCLDSIHSSYLKDICLDIWVVDNNSVDGSVSAIKRKYPEVNIIANNKNLGFGKANNQVILESKSDFCLLLNPDTIIEENSIQHCIEVISDDPKLGAVGIKMVDGSGNYLRESKRSLPSLIGALTKLTKIGDIFPKSHFFNSYYTSDLKGDQAEYVEVLCGAFMFCRTEVLQSLGGFDEDFFLYGEDIDLCKRMIDSGWKIRYSPDSNIIHYKGESSKKASLNYLHSFYNSMLIYLKKHHNSSWGKLTNVIVRVGILLLGFIRGLKEYSKLFFHPVVDFILVFLGMGLLKDLWAKLYFGVEDYYDDNVFLYNQTIYAFIWIWNLWFWGWYDGKRKFKSLFYGLVIGSLILLSIYALLPLEFRTSRTLLLIGAMMTFGVVLLTNRLGETFTGLFGDKGTLKKKIIIVGYKENVPKILEQLNNAGVEFQLQGVVAPVHEHIDTYYLNSINHLNELIRRYKTDEIIFIHQDISSSEIIDSMTMNDANVSYKISGGNKQIVGSSDQSSSGEIYDTYSTHHLSRNIYKRLKRSMDIILGIIFIFLFPIFLFNKKTRSLLSNAFTLLIGSKTLVSYNNSLPTENLPIVRDGLIGLSMEVAPKEYLRLIDDNLNHWYSLSYSPFIDLEILKNYIFRK